MKPWRAPLLVLVGLIACGRAAPSTSDAPLGAERSGMGAAGLNPVSGTVFALKPAGDVLVRLYSIDASNAERGPKLAEGRTKADGSFTVDAGTYEGPALVEADVTPSLVLQLALANVAIGSPATHWAVTPITTLAATYAGFLTREPVAWGHAVTQASNAIDSHFFGFPHATVVPTAWPVASGASQGPCHLEQASMRASLLGWGLASEGVTYLQVGDQKLTPEEGLEQMLAGLREDLRGDGRWDGNATGNKLSEKYVELESEAARDKLADAIEAFFATPANGSDCTVDQIGKITNRLRSNATAPFTALKVRPKVIEEPVAPPSKPSVRCEVRDEEGNERQFDETLRGTLQVDCLWEAQGGLREIGLEGHENSVWLTPRPSENPHLLSFLLDTKLAEEVLQLQQIRVGIRGEDACHQLTSELLVFSVHNARPRCEVGAAVGATWQDPWSKRLWYGQGTEIAIPVHVHQSSRLVELFANREIVAKVDLPPAGFGGNELIPVTLAARLPQCDQKSSLMVVVTDVAGNQSSTVFDALCSSRGPKIQPLRGIYTGDFAGPADDIHRGWDGDKFPRLNKFYHHFDYEPAIGKDVETQNLPTMRFAIDDSTSGHLAYGVTVRYTYRLWRSDPDGEGLPAVRERWWQSIEPTSGGYYEIPLSYQTLLPQDLIHVTDVAKASNFIATSKPNDLHEILVQVKNEAGQTDERSFRFYLNFKGPPLVLRNFRLAPNVVNAKYDYALRELSSGADLVLADVEWDLGAGASLMPDVDLEMTARVQMSVDSVVERVDQWDRGWCDWGDYCHIGDWHPPSFCEKEQLIFNSQGHNAAWSMSRGCHPPVNDRYADDHRNVRMLRNAAVYAHDANLIQPRRWAQNASYDRSQTVGRLRGSQVAFHFPFQTSGDSRWKLTRGREGLFQEYHVVSEDDFHFTYKQKHILTTDYFVHEFEARALVPSAENITWRVLGAPLPGPSAVIVEAAGTALVRHWTPADQGRSFPRKLYWEPSQRPTVGAGQVPADVDSSVAHSTGSETEPRTGLIADPRMRKALERFTKRSK